MKSSKLTFTRGIRSMRVFTQDQSLIVLLGHFRHVYVESLGDDKFQNKEESPQIKI